MATLITGGAGFIGSRLAKRLLEQGGAIVVLDNLDSYYDPAIKAGNSEELGEKANFIKGDIRDRALVESIFEQYPINRVAHMAAMSNVRYSTERGLLYAEVNTNGSVILLDTARKHDVSIFVMGSTSSVYGHTSRVPFVEDDAADHPLAPYPASKRAAELFGYSYHQLFDLNVTILRCCDVYGPNGRPDMMPMRVIDAILNDKTIEKFEGGTLQRDWTYVEDILDGIVAALERPLGYQIINLGNGAPITLNAFIRTLEQLIEKEAITVDVPTPLTEPRITYCDNTRARQLLGFNPKVSVEEGLARTWAWYQERFLNGKSG